MRQFNYLEYCLMLRRYYICNLSYLLKDRTIHFSTLHEKTDSTTWVSIDGFAHLHGLFQEIKSFSLCIHLELKIDLQKNNLNSLFRVNQNLQVVLVSFKKVCDLRNFWEHKPWKNYWRYTSRHLLRDPTPSAPSSQYLLLFSFYLKQD